MYLFQCVKAVTEKKGVNFSLCPLWVGLNLKQGKFGFNSKRSFLAISLLNQGIGLPG